MPLLPGKSNAVKSANISELRHSGYPENQSIAIALSNARRHPRRADGGGIPDAGEIFSGNRQYITPATQDYNTELPSDQETQFRAWVKQNDIPFDVDAPVSDYDMRGFYSAMQSGDKMARSAVDPNDNKIHYPDFWKTPFHKTFSNESQWALPDAPHWTKDDKLVDKTGRIIFDDRKKRASGGIMDAAQDTVQPTPDSPFHEEGLFHSDVAGRTDRLPRTVPADSFVFPADVVSALGQGNTLAGAKLLDGIFGKAKLAAGGPAGNSSVIVAGGEYLASRDKLEDIGRRLRTAKQSKAKTDINAGHEWARSFVDKVRKHQLDFLKTAPKPKK